MTVSQSKEYQAHQDMIQRCHNPKRPCYRHYGGRGITVCDEWKNSFAAFIGEIGPAPRNVKCSVERIDNEKGYCPGNVRWANYTDQARNRRNNTVLIFNGRRQCVAAWALELGMRVITLRKRLGSGWSVRDSLSRPVRPYGQEKRTRRAA